MKVRKTLLAAIAVAVAVGTSATSCTKVADNPTEADGPKTLECEVIEETSKDDSIHDCEACGMG